MNKRKTMKGILLLNGEKPKKIEYSENDFIVCCDGAYDYAVSMGIKTDILIGDMDSIKEKNIEAKTLKFDAIKDYTDGELGIDYLINKGITEIDIYGGGGKREDHFLGNVMLLNRALEKGVKASMITNYSKISIFDKPFELFLNKDTLISLLPFYGDVHILNTEGLFYPINDKSLPYNGTLGISNVVTSERVFVNLSNGKVLVLEQFQ